MGELTFELISEESSWSSLINSLWEVAIDPPVFYHHDLLTIYQDLRGGIEVAIAFRNLQPIIALPITNTRPTTNIVYDGWDNLELITKKNVKKEELMFFWTQLLRCIGSIKLVSFSHHFKIESHHFFSLEVLRRKCPYIDINENWEQLELKLGKKLLRNIRQYGNKASNANISFSVYKAQEVNSQKLKQKLKRAYSFHDSRMKELKLNSKFTPSEFQEYNWMVISRAKNAFCIEAVNQNRELVAFYYGLFNYNRLAWFNGGYNSEYNKFSIGTLLIKHLIDWAFSDKLNYFDCLRGRETYKLKWTKNFDQNKDIYLTSNTLINKNKLAFRFLLENRRRIGFALALKELKTSWTA
jgi:hypothetical protein